MEAATFESAAKVTKQNAQWIVEDNRENH